MDEDEPIIISAINRYAYCPRRCALAHLEQMWNETVHTARGNEVHENVDIDSSHMVQGIRCERALPIWSKRLNIVGKADLVEFRGNVPYPVEYKVSKRKSFENNFLQLCAQAVCLEEMFGVRVEKGALYWHGSRERQEIAITDAMRRQLEDVIAAVHNMIAEKRLPPPVNDERCRDCSLREACMPQIAGDEAKNKRAAKELFECI